MLSFDPLVDAHLDYLRQCGRSARTIYQRNRSLVRLADVLPTPLIDATAADLALWRAALTCGEEAVKHYVGDVRQFYRWAIDEGHYPGDNPAAKLPVPRMGRRIPRPISDDRLFAALEQAPDRIRPWLVLAGWAGLRAKEIAYLRRQHVLDTANPPVVLIVHDATKGRAERIVPLSDFVLAELRRWLPAHGWVFLRRDGRPGPNSPHLVSTTCNRFLHELGYTDTLHQLRHRFGTMLYRQTKDLRLVQEAMGHADPRTTAGYAAYDQADTAAAVAKLPAPRRMKAV